MREDVVKFVEWQSFSGYHGKLVAAQANNLELSNFEGVFDVYRLDVLKDDELKPMLYNGYKCVHDALAAIASYGLSGWHYRIISRETGRRWTIRL